jgi:Leucine-rich repeat (LRR) protein
MNNLEDLAVTFSHITEIPDDISKLQKLKTLNFDYTDIQQLPEALYQLRNLKSISVKNTQLTIEEIIKFRKHMPEVRLTYTNQ